MANHRRSVVIIGARGIGRHHAKWWHIENADVRGFAGRTAASLGSTATTLREMFAFEGQGYDDVADMLAECKPDIVDVCSPNPHHGKHVRQALAAGCDVLCEKPFVYDPHRAADELLDEARQLIDMAATAGKALGLCSQYAVTAERCRELLGRPAGQPVTEFRGCLASPARGRAADPAIVWFDLGPHLLAAAQALAPDADLDPASVEVEAADFSVVAHFALVRPDAPPLRCRVHVHRTHAEPSHIRQLELDGVPFDIQGGKDSDGLYGARIVSGNRTVEDLDPLRLTIRRMLVGQPSIQGAAIHRNMSLLLAFAHKLPTSPGGRKRGPHSPAGTNV